MMAEKAVPPPARSSNEVESQMSLSGKACGNPSFQVFR